MKQSAKQTTQSGNISTSTIIHTRLTSSTKQEYTNWCAMIVTNSALDRLTDHLPQYDRIKVINHPYIKSNYTEIILSIGHKYTNI